ncbi:MAG TPA: hypothetical protein VK616_11710, partial [Flavitalea sp.]|nr:hypothetical protein [Flavitalea sp.]
MVVFWSSQVISMLLPKTTTRSLRSPPSFAGGQLLISQTFAKTSSYLSKPIKFAIRMKRSFLFFAIISAFVISGMI